MSCLLQAGWKENLATFINELKNLQCLGLTTMGAALKHAFDVLNINRMQTGIDTYGQGRCPFYLEPSVIVVITDGGKLSSNAGIQEEVRKNLYKIALNIFNIYFGLKVLLTIILYINSIINRISRKI